jgi:tight adherence protein C
MVALALALLAAAGVAAIFYGLFKQPAGFTSEMVQERLQAYEGNLLSLDEQELQRPFSERFIRPAIERFGRLLSERTPERSRIELANKLHLAGRPYGLTPSDFVAIRLIFAVVCGVAGVMVGLLLHTPLGVAAGGAVGGLGGYFFPVLWLRQLVQRRQREIQRSLPDALDLLTISVEAGLGFEAALSRVAEKFANALGHELGQVLIETRLGRPRLEALDDLGRRVGVEDLHNFVQAVIQSEQMGVGIAKILRIQSDEMRRKRRQRAQEKAAQASLKMLLPMVGCIFPTLWIVLLGPAVLIVMAARH